MCAAPKGFVFKLNFNPDNCIFIDHILQIAIGQILCQITA